MNHTILLRKLIAIERAIGVANNNTIRNMVYEAESYLLQLQRDYRETLPADAKRWARQLYEFSA